MCFWIADSYPAQRKVIIDAVQRATDDSDSTSSESADSVITHAPMNNAPECNFNSQDDDADNCTDDDANDGAPHSTTHGGVARTSKHNTRLNEIMGIHAAQVYQCMSCGRSNAERMYARADHMPSFIDLALPEDGHVHLQDLLDDLTVQKTVDDGFKCAQRRLSSQSRRPL